MPIFPLITSIFSQNTPGETVINNTEIYDLSE